MNTKGPGTASGPWHELSNCWLTLTSDPRVHGVALAPPQEPLDISAPSVLKMGVFCLRDTSSGEIFLIPSKGQPTHLAQ